MRIGINLATQPYENVRRFFLFWGSVLAVAIALSGGLIYYAVNAWKTSRSNAQTLEGERRILARYQAEEDADMAILNKPENRDVRARSLLINSLIRQKEFSWTLIFADLERIMPTRLHVVSISPQLNRANQIEVHMIVAGDSREKAVELVQNMEKSAAFRYPAVRSETANPSARETGSRDLIQFDISALYQPAAAPPPAPGPRSGQ